MVRGRRSRNTAKGQHKVTVADMKKDLKPIRKMATNDVSDLIAIETITQRTRNLRKSLHKIQKEFDNQAITKFFQRTLKANTYMPQFSSDNNENACDAEQLSDNDNQLARINDDNKELFSHANNENDDANKNDNVFLINGNNDQNDQNTDGTTTVNITTNSIQPTNIFLQKPVLHLNIDKSLNQASSIVINKHLEVVGPNFATSFPAFNNNSVLNTANNIQSKSSEDESSAEQNDVHTSNESIVKGQKTKGDKPRLRNRRPRKCASQWTIDNNGALIDAIIDSDSNSCDSGVVSDRSFELNSTDGNKPTTPHRIVCPSTSTTSTPTHEETPDKCSRASNILNRMNQVKRATAKRARGKQTQKSPRFNDAKLFFTKLTAVADVQAKIAEDIKTEENLIKEESKNNYDCEMSAIKIEPNDVQIVKCPTPKPMLSRSSTPLQKPMQLKQMTDFFPVRRSIRKTKKAVEQEHLRHIEKAIEQQCEDGLVVKYFKEKGRGICAGRPFARGAFVVEYIGDLIEQNEADRREEIYAKDAAFGCYMYYFKHKEQQWCIDATAETGKLGRLVNHSRNGNLVTKIVTYKNQPHLVLIAKENIKEGEELTYDYGDRTRESLVNHPWLAL